MQLRWSEEAADDLERITNYLFVETPQHAAELVRAIYNGADALLTFAHRGRPGKKRGSWCFRHCLTLWSIEFRVTQSTFFAFFTAHRDGPSVRRSVLLTRVRRLL